MSQENNFIPNQENYKPLTPFHLFVKSNFPFIEATYEALDNYGLYCKIVEYLNNVIENENTVEDNVTALYNAFVSLNTYVSNYFDNLDVQEEINNKLDEMVNSGELQQLLRDLNQETIDYLNRELININSKITTLGTATPIVVNSTTDMIDTTKLYVLASSGHWYYYNGSTWTDGGVYQAISILDGSVDLLSLNDLLQANFNTKYGTDLDLGQSSPGYCNENSSTGKVRVNSGNNYSYYKVALSIGDIYEYNGGNSLAMCGLLIADSADNVLYNSNVPTASTQYEGTSKIFKVNQSGCYAYISKYLGAGNRYLFLGGTRLRKLTDVSNNLKTNTDITKIQTSNNNYFYGTLNNIINISTDSSYTNFDAHLYSIEKGKKYHVESYNYQSAPGILVTNNNTRIIYTSLENPPYNSATFCEYDFTANENGYVAINQPLNNEFKIEQVIDGINIEDSSNKIKNKKIGADGDSISAGVGGNYSYVTQIANKNNCTLQNLSVGGGTIASETYSGETPRHWICESVENLDSNCDIIMLSGGVNDYWNKVPMGEITDDYTTEVDSTTFYGGLEKMCRSVLDRFKTQKIVFVTYHKINNIYNTYNSSTGERHTFKEYLDAIYEVMNKYSIPVIDINAKGRFNTSIDYYKNNYTNNSDGVHPTTNGYLYFYNSIVENEINNLL